VGLAFAGTISHFWQDVLHSDTWDKRDVRLEQAEPGGQTRELMISSGLVLGYY
jgi:hypothetical protein